MWTTTASKVKDVDRQGRNTSIKSPTFMSSKGDYSFESETVMSSPKSDGFNTPPRGRSGHPQPSEDPKRHSIPKTAVPPFFPDPISRIQKEVEDQSQLPINATGLLVPEARRSPVGKDRRRSLSAFGTRALSPRRELIDDGTPLKAIGYALMGSLQRPQRTEEGPPKLRDVAQYWIRLMKLRKAIGVWFASRRKASLCNECKGLGLVHEHFVLLEDDTTDTSKIPLQMLRGTGREPLGTLKEIADKAWVCALCRLIIASLREQGGRFTLLHPDVAYHGFPPALNEYNSKCWISWHTDDRNRVMGGYRSGARRPRSVARTRRLRIEWADSRIEPFFIGKVADPFGAGRGNDPINYLHSTQPTSIAVIRGWLGRCKREHDYPGSPCSVKPDGLSHTRNKQAFFGVIDLQEMRLTSLPPDSRYVALSYTWGNKGDFKCKRKNVRELQQFEGIMRIQHELPRVIQDAMELTRGLGERYLWVDSLCIVQDSEASWQLNANVMHEVYRQATCTICAADGTDAMSGLAALSTDRNDEKRHAKQIGSYSRGFNLMASYPAEYYIKKSAWDTRAWTFQERLLSRRCIIFAGGKIFFQCNSMTLREEIFAGDMNGWPAEVAGTPADLVKEISSRPLKVYTECVELYTRRFLTNEKDILNAFQGVNHVVSVVLGNRGTLHGLPRSHFDWALLWQCKGRSKYRGDQTAVGVVPKVVEDMPSRFPTWSWAGWYNPEDLGGIRSRRGVAYNPEMLSGVTTNVRDWLRRHTWITWYVRDSQGDLRLVWTPNEPHKMTISEQSRWAGYQKPGPDTDRYGRLPESRRDESPIQPDPPEFNLTLEDFPYSVSVGPEHDGPPRWRNGGLEEIHSPDLRYLQFFTWSAHFTLKQFDRFEEELDSKRMLEEGLDVRLRTEPDPRWAIIDKHGELSGIITPDRTSWRHHAKGYGIDLYTGEHQFIAISEAKEFSKAETEGWAEYMSTEAEGIEWNLYYVLLVAEVAGVCHRIGLGKIYKEAFDHGFKGAKKWREIILG